MSEFADFVKQKRGTLGLSLRKFCDRHGLDPSNWSKLERGRLAPPQGDRLDEYAGFLEIKAGTDEWFRFRDLAAAAAGRVPADLMESEIAAKLPVLFRTLREAENHGGDTEELLRSLKRKLRES